MTLRAERAWELGDVFVLRHAGFPFDWIESLGISTAVTDDILGWLDAGSPPDREESLETAFEAERRRLRERLHELARDPKVQEAVFLSSPEMFENVWRRHADGPLREENASVRRVERQVYAYVQRLCAKNETTSFFGPMGYGEIDGEDDVIEIVPAGEPRRRTFVAYWAVEALARAMAVEPEIWRMLPMRRNPLFTVDETTREARCDSLDRVEPLSDDEWRLLDAVGASPRAEDLAANLGMDLVRVEAVAMSLFERAILIRRLWFRSDVPDTLALLRAEVERLGPSAARARWIEHLARLDAMRASFEVSALRDRRRILGDMEDLFRQLTGASARRAGGRLYTDRLILNEEASSPFRIRIGRKAASKLAATLSPLLEISAAYGERYREGCRESVERALGGGGPVSFPRYAILARDAPRPDLAPARVDVAGGAPAQLPPDVWGRSAEGARFALPDLCLGRRADGALHPVLARMHHQLLTRGWLFTFHPDVARTDRVAARWVRTQTPEEVLVELASGRHNKGYYSFPGPRVAYVSAETAPREHPVLYAADLVVSREARGPVLRDRDGSALRLYLPLADLTLHPPFAALATPLVAQAPIGANGDHSPRFDLGDATYQRARWQVAAGACDGTSTFRRFVAMQREKKRLGLPRFVFARVPSERKPFLVDTDSPFAVELLRHHLRENATVTFEEMLPSPDQLWLRDARGRYTFELRIQATRDADA